MIALLSLLIGFLVFVTVEAIGRTIAPQAIPLHVQTMHFIQGFLACASGIALGVFIIAKKDKEIFQHLAVEKALLAEREDFLAVINHRLRNSLLATDRIVALLLNGDFGKFQPNQQTILEAISDNNREVDRMIRMLVDIYQYRNGTKQIQPVACELSGIIQRVLQNYQTMAADKSITVSHNVTNECTAKCTHSELENLLSHIVENAIRHARSSVIVTATKQNGNVYVAITDDGIGIPEVDQSYLFNRFWVSSQDGKYAAVTGIGLCLCAEIAKAHGGKLTCESRVGSGTTFSLTLPANS